MRAAICTAFEGPDAVATGDAPDPVPARDEVLVEVRAASVSYMDLLMIEGGYQLRPELPYVPGTDAAGYVVEVGADVEGFSPGDLVIATGWHGAYAERMAAKHWRCNRIPAGVDMTTACTVAHAYLTAHYCLVERAEIRAGETLLITGAAGGVGLATTDLGRLLGARVIAVIGDASKAEVVRRAGAAEVIDLRTEDLRARVKEITGGRGVDVCVEMIGGEVFQTLARLMAWGGRLMPIGFTSGDVPKLAMNLPLLKNYSVVGVFTGAWLDLEPDRSSAAVDTLLAHIAAGRLSPRVDRVLPLEQVGEALRLVADRQVQGRVVLAIGQV